MTVQELIVYLETLPKDAEVVRVVEVQKGCETHSEFIPAVVNDNIYFDGTRLGIGDV